MEKAAADMMNSGMEEEDCRRSNKTAEESSSSEGYEDTAVSSASASASASSITNEGGGGGEESWQFTATAEDQKQFSSTSGGWELTWPIWHMLPREERRQLAKSHGYKTIGEFEEYMSLQQAVGETTTTIQKPYENRLIYNGDDDDGSLKEKDPGNKEEEEENKKPAAAKKAAAEEEEDDEEEDGQEQKLLKEVAMEQEHAAVSDKLPTNELVKYGGAILILPEDILHKVFAWLPVDFYATLALVSPHWKSFTRTENVYKKLCERLYLKQCRRKFLHVSKFNNSYRTMLERRPRVRAGGGGVYVLKYARVKPIQRDMWTEVPLGAVLEMVYYRYLYFQEDGRVLYALTATPPHEMFPRLLRVARDHGGGGGHYRQQQQQLEHDPPPPPLPTSDDPAAVWGTYNVQKTRVTVSAQQSWQYVQFGLTIDVSNNNNNNVLQYGRYGCLTLDWHMSSVKGDFSHTSNDKIKYDVPTEPFRFVRDGRL